MDHVVVSARSLIDDSAGVVFGTDRRTGPRAASWSQSREQAIVDRHSVIDDDRLERLIAAPAVAGDQPIEEDPCRSETTSLGRRPPAAPFAIAAIDEQPLNDDVQIGGELAAAFEAAQHFVVPLDEVHADVGTEIVRFGATHVMASTHLRRHIVDDGKGGEKACLVSHKGRHRRRAHASRRRRGTVRVPGRSSVQ